MITFGKNRPACGERGGEDWPPPLPLVVAAFVDPGEGAEEPLGAVFSFKVKREYEGRLPPPPGPPVLGPFTSRRACAPKLTRRANDGETGVFIGTFVESPSSMTAGSSPKLFLNSGEPEPDDVDTLARRCFAKAVNGLD